MLSGTVTWEKAGPEFQIKSSLGGQSGLIVTGHGSPAFVSPFRLRLGLKLAFASSGLEQLQPFRLAR